MRTAWKVGLLVTGGVLISGAVGAYRLFHGYYDRGRFVITQIQWSPTKQVAMVVERSDDSPLDGNTYFVLIGDRVLSPSELPRAYHSEAPVFAAADDCVDVRWRTATTLTISCKGHQMLSMFVDFETSQRQKIAIAYENIPPISR